MMNISPRQLYGAAARFDITAGLNEDQLRRLAPSVFAVEAHDSRSDRFQPIPTIEIIRGLAKEGFQVVGATQSTARDPGKREFTKHLLRLRRLDDTRHQVGDVLPEVILKNANDGTAAYELMAGLFRIRCMNSLVSQVSTLESTKVRHSGSAQKVRDLVIDGTYRVIDAAREALAAPADWSQIRLEPEHRQLLAAAAHEIRWPTGDQDEEPAQRIQAGRLLEARRPDDRAADLWTTFNVIQENTVRGGQRFIQERFDERGRRTTRRASTREVKGVDQLVGLNRALWMITSHFAKEAGGIRLAA